MPKNMVLPLKYCSICMVHVQKHGIAPKYCSISMIHVQKHGIAPKVL